MTQPKELAYASTSPVVDGVLPCCHMLHIDSTGNVNASNSASFWAANNFTALRKAGKTVTVEIGGDQTTCVQKTSCAIWENRVKIASDLIAFAAKHDINGFTLDWEFGKSSHTHQFHVQSISTLPAYM